MISFKDTDFLHAGSRIKTLEKKLINERQLSVMAEAHTLDEAWKIANDAGIGGSLPPAEYEKAISQNLEEAYAFLRGLAGGHDFLDLLRYENDALNLKILVKAQAMDKQPEGLTEQGSVPSAVLREEFRLGKYEKTPPVLARAVVEATEVAARTGDPQYVDIIIDRAMLLSMSEKAAGYNIGFLHKLVKTRIDIANLRSLVRVKRIDKDTEFFKRVAAPGGYIDVDILTDAFTKGMDGVISFIEGTRYGPTLEPSLGSLRAGGPLTHFERLCDNCLNNVLDSVRLIPFGVEILILYAVAKEAEAKGVRIVMASRIAGVSPHLIKERLRETYA